MRERRSTIAQSNSYTLLIFRSDSLPNFYLQLLVQTGLHRSQFPSYHDSRLTQPLWAVGPATNYSWQTHNQLRAQQQQRDSFEHHIQQQYPFRSSYQGTRVTSSTQAHASSTVSTAARTTTPTTQRLSTAQVQASQNESVRTSSRRTLHNDLHSNHEPLGDASPPRTRQVCTFPQVMQICNLRVSILANLYRYYPIGSTRKLEGAHSFGDLHRLRFADLI
jgi:hypothetical protein